MTAGTDCRRGLSCCLLASLLLLQQPGRARSAATENASAETVRIAFAAAEGARLRKHFSREVELRTVQRDSLPDLGKWRDEQHVVLVDEYGPLEDQVPDSIERTFERIDLAHTHAWELPLVFGRSLSGRSERVGTGELQGSSVLFTRDHTEPELPSGIHEASYVVSLAEAAEPSRASDLGLEGLSARADSTGLLPWRPVAVGDHWFVDVDAFREICWPGGALELLDPDGEFLPTPIDERLGQNLEGTFRVELEAIDEVGGIRHARLRIRGQLESRATFRYEWSTGDHGLTLSHSGPIELSLCASARGALRWNLDGGHLDSMHLEADVTIDQAVSALELTLGGRVFECWLTSTGPRRWSGKLSADAVFELL